jgi:hypothetical protein
MRSSAKAGLINLAYTQDAYMVANDLETAIWTGCRHSGEIFAIGRSALYEALLPRAEMKS